MVNTGFRSITPWHLLGFVLASAVLVGIIAAAWKFGFEEWIDPFLPGVHDVDSEGEQWEFVLLSSFFPALLWFFRHSSFIACFIGPPLQAGLPKPCSSSPRSP